MTNIWRCAYDSTGPNGVELVNTFHIKADPGALSSEATAHAVADGVDSWLTTLYRAVAPDNFTVNSLAVRQEVAPGSGDVPSEWSKTIGTAGTRASSGWTLPVPMCMLVSVKTNAAVRSGHGRMFMPPGLVPGALLAGGLWSLTLTYGTAVSAFFDALLAGHDIGTEGIDASHLSYVIYSRTRRQAGLSQYYFDVTSYVRRAAPHWLRSRSTAP